VECEIRYDVVSRDMMFHKIFYNAIYDVVVCMYNLTGGISKKRPPATSKAEGKTTNIEELVNSQPWLTYIFVSVAYLENPLFSGIYPGVR